MFKFSKVYFQQVCHSAESKHSIRILLERLEPEFLRNEKLCVIIKYSKERLQP
ncbi:hypothetical protein ACFP3I_08145 [Chryseobacterium arachidis]|uniref:hypothetical protein n=1 Tax=Chryseobacterium arachidis TaxID=1416778 RepID=UPI00362218C7